MHHSTQESLGSQEATVGSKTNPEQELQGLAHRVNETATLQRLQHLCLQSHDLKFIGAMVAFISTRECSRILSDWSNESRHASHLERLARAIEPEGNLLNKLRPFKSDQRVEDRFKNHLQEHYLASMIAARRAFPSDETATWLQRLRVFILIRALDALDAGAAREQHLWDVCTTVRDVCESELSSKRPWIQSIRGSATGFHDFSSETAMNCRHELSKAGQVAGSAFLRSLLWVLESNQWSTLPIKNRLTESNLSPYPTQPSTANWTEFFRYLDDKHPNSDGQTTPLVQSAAGISAHATDVDQAQSKRIRLGNGLRLERIEHSLFLRHSWHHLSKVEGAYLLSRVEDLLSQANFADCLGAAVTTLAVLANQSMHDVRKMQLSPPDADDWYLDLASGHLIRKPPRFGRRWRSASAGAGVDSWIHPLAEQWVYQLHPKVCVPLRKAASLSQTAQNIGDLWEQVNQNQTPANWFNTRVTDTSDLKRLTSPSTANLVATAAFEISHDQALTRLICSDHRTALPAACAYGAYKAPMVLRSLADAVQSGLGTLVIPLDDANLNCCGSELDIILPKLRSTIAELIKRVDTAAKSGSWIEHHNLLTALSVLSLLASTGARPVNSAFETLGWFDLTHGRIFVEDKATGPTQGSRICVLSDFAKSLLQTRYLPHLTRVAKATAPSAPRFASAIDKVLQGAVESPMPLFFFIRSGPVFDWMEVSESQLTSICQLNWPLPWNLFRHMTSTLLPRWGLHPDIRDALLGHADHDAESHGEYSSRTPNADFEEARPLVNRLQAEIGFYLPTAAELPSISGTAEMDKSISLLPRAYGKKARAGRRSETLESARRSAKADIDFILGHRTVDQLSSDELDAIARKMIARPDGMPHIQGSVRYAVFEEVLNEAWRMHRHHAQIKRRYVLSLEGRQVFNESVIYAQKRLDAVACAFDDFLSARDKHTERPVLAAFMAAIDTVLHSRVANLPLICALLSNHKSIQLIRFRERFWLEWAFSSAWCDGKPVFRVEISRSAASWMSISLSGKSYKEVPPFPSALAPIAFRIGIQETELDRFFSELIKLQSQVNYLEMPGLMAAYLNGKRQSSGLPHSEWIRTWTGEQPARIPLTIPESFESDDEAVAAEHFFRSHHQPTTPVPGPALQRCSQLFQEIGSILNTDDNHSRIATAIASSVKKSGFGRGDAPYLLAHFALHLLKRKPKRGKRDRLRSKTALRYWYSLSGPFLESAADANLLDMAEDELTALYQDIVGTWSAGKSVDLEEANGGKNETIDDRSYVSPASRDDLSDAAFRTAEQLREFHEFSYETYGLVEPDWSEVCDGEAIGVGRPGLVLLKEYQATLSLILEGKAPAELDDFLLSLAFVLVACCRFGLRIGEAVGLHRCDWGGLPGAEVVLVQSNSTRPLKTDSSRRKVPLIEDLDCIESAVVSVVLNRWTHRNGESTNSPLLPNVSRASFKYERNRISGYLLQTIKRVTGSDSSTVHMLRHAYAMRVLSRLLNLPLDPAVNLTMQEVRSTRLLLLGRDTCDRRTLWAVARLLGHSNPGTTIQSYINCLFAWLPENRRRTDRSGIVQLNQLEDLDSLPLQSGYLNPNTKGVLVSSTAKDPLLLRSLRLLRLIVVGQPMESAAGNSDVAISTSNALASAMNRASERLSFSETRYAGFKLLAGISVDRMTMLANIAANQIPSTCMGESFENWEYTIGASRQILLFERVHIAWFSNFCSQLKLTDADVWLIAPSDKSNSFSESMAASQIARFCHSKHEVSRTFQLDVARFGEPELIAPHRFAVVARESGQLKSSFELLTLWVTWIFSESQLANELA